jgi:3-oxoacyl-[acyl-carrier protein] reductase
VRELDGMVGLVTGAAKNIGRAIALDLARNGASIAVVTKTDEAAAKSVVAEIVANGGSATAVLADVSDIDAVARMVAQVVAKFGQLDILVNNAGIRPESAFESITVDEWRSVLSVNLDGAFHCCQAALPHLEKSERAAIINIGGMTGHTGASHRAHVVAAKAGLDGLTKALAMELAPRGITVNMVSPGLIDTERGDYSSKTPVHHKRHVALVGRRGRPEEVSALVRYLAGPDARYLTGQTMHVNGGAYLP